MPDFESGSAGTATAERRDAVDGPHLSGVAVRERDVEPVKGIRAIAVLFRGMAILLLLLMVLQVIFGVTSTVPISPGVLIADAVRLVIFAGLLWGGGDLAVLIVKSHYDLRATKILVARIEYLLQEQADINGGET
jgi:hypothetical protein